MRRSRRGAASAATLQEHRWLLRTLGRIAGDLAMAGVGGRGLFVSATIQVRHLCKTLLDAGAIEPGGVTSRIHDPTTQSLVFNGRIPKSSAISSSVTPSGRLLATFTTSSRTLGHGAWAREHPSRPASAAPSQMFPSGAAEPVAAAVIALGNFVVDRGDDQPGPAAGSRRLSSMTA